jgi:hypothetical protein
VSANLSRRDVLIASLQAVREQQRALLREIYPAFAHLNWKTVRVNGVDIDCQCEVIDDDHLEIRCAMLDGADVTELAEKLGLDELVNREWVSA